MKWSNRDCFFTVSNFSERSGRTSPYSGFTEQSDRTSPYSGFTEQSDIASPYSGFKLKTNLFSFLGWRTQAANRDRRYLLTLGAALLLFFGGWVFGILSPMADHSGQTTRERVKLSDVSSTLTWVCEITSIYTNL